MSRSVREAMDILEEVLGEDELGTYLVEVSGMFVWFAVISAHH